jgi:hypothetical protein
MEANWKMPEKDRSSFVYVVEKFFQRSLVMTDNILVAFENSAEKTHSGCLRNFVGVQQFATCSAC